jgi:hypothetical protein
MSVKDAIEREKLYFATHPIYSTMPNGTLGTEILSQKLTKVMFTHIKHNLPEITKEIKDKAKDIEERLRDFRPTSTFRVYRKDASFVEHDHRFRDHL